jgi:hypothetical protein
VTFCGSCARVTLNDSHCTACGGPMRPTACKCGHLPRPHDRFCRACGVTVPLAVQTVLKLRLPLAEAV